MSLVNFQQFDKIATLVLNDPDHHNRLGRPMIDQFLAALDDFDLSDARVLIV
jgi:enoyl-CoA hydratase/carnithine racemase